MELLDTAPEPAFDRQTRLASKLMSAPIVLTSLSDRLQWLKSRIHVAFTEIAREIGQTAQLAATQ